MAQHEFAQAQVITPQQVDETNGVIRGVSMISEGPVLGHTDIISGQPLFVDGTTLQQVLSSAQTYQTGLKVKADHGSGIFAVCGFLDNYAIDGSVLRADFHVLDSEPNKAKIFEMASTMPDCFGFSVSFDGEDEIVNNQLCTRCDEIFSCDLVTEPAACPTGLFSRRRVDAVRKGNMAAPIQSAPPAPAPKQAAPSAKGADDAALPSLADLAASHKQLMEAMKGHLARFSKMEAAVAALAPSIHAPEPDGDPDANGNSAPGASGDAEDDEHLPFAAAASPAMVPAKPVAKPGGVAQMGRNAELREMGRSLAQELAKEFAAKLGQSPIAAAAPSAPGDKSPDAGDNPEDKFIASVQKHFKATGSKTKALTAASHECGDTVHRAFVASGKRIEFKRD